jgi:probable addiction module antidote protein
VNHKTRNFNYEEKLCSKPLTLVAYKITGGEMMTRSRNYRDDLLKSLQDPAEAQAYLNAALEEGKEVFFLALKDVVDAQKGMTQLAKDINRSRESLYKTLSTNGHPEFMGIYEILESLGYHMTIINNHSASSNALYS